MPNGGAVLQTAVLVCSRFVATVTLGVVKHDLLALVHDLRADDESRPGPFPARLTAFRPLTHRPSATSRHEACGRMLRLGHVLVANQWPQQPRFLLNALKRFTVLLVQRVIRVQRCVTFANGVWR